MNKNEVIDNTIIYYNKNNEWNKSHSMFCNEMKKFICDTEWNFIIDTAEYLQRVFVVLRWPIFVTKFSHFYRRRTAMGLYSIVQFMPKARYLLI